VLTPAAYAATIPLATRFTDGVASVIRDLGLPWIVKQLGCRAEYWFRPTPPHNGILMTPFHNMALIAPQTTPDDIDHHTRVFRESVEAILAD